MSRARDTAPSLKGKIHVVSHTDTGRVRDHNEDALLIDDARGLYVVADGVGGHAKGEVASAEAVEQIQNWVIRHEPLVQEYLPAALGDDELGAIVDEAIAEAGATSPRDMGAVMKLVMPRVGAQAEGSRVSAMVKSRLVG